MQFLSAEILLLIFHKLYITDLLNLCRVCKNWRRSAIASIECYQHDNMSYIEEEILHRFTLKITFERTLDDQQEEMQEWYQGTEISPAPDFDFSVCEDEMDYQAQLPSTEESYLSEDDD